MIARIFKFIALALICAGVAASVQAQSSSRAERTLGISARVDAPAGEQRIALVIGNAAYKEAPLANPVNDARAMAEMLTRLGFKVTKRENANRREMFEAIRVFGDAIRSGGAGLFYFAGHGIQSKGRNFLVPIGTQIEREDEIAAEAIEAAFILEKMETARNRVNIVILDACRNNPFARSFRSSAQGLAQMDAPVGTLLAYATAPGSVASDGRGRNGLYTEQLLAQMREPGVKIEDVFKRVRVAVRETTGGKQIPWENTSMTGDFYFNAPRGAEAVKVTPPTDLAVELAFWDSIKTSTNPADFRAYLNRFPEGQFAELARIRGGGAAPAIPTPQGQPAATPALAPAPAQLALAAPGAARPGSAIGAKLNQISDGSKFAQFSSDGNRALISRGYKISIVDLPTFEEKAKFDWDSKGSLERAFISPDGTWVVASDHYGKVTAWDADKPAPKWRYQITGGSGTSSALGLSHGARMIVAGYGGTMVWLDPRSGRELYSVKTAHSTIEAFAFSPDGNTVASVGYSVPVIIWELSSGRELRRLDKPGNSLASAQFTPDGATLVAGDTSRDIIIWDLATGSHRVLKGHESKVDGVAVSPDGRLLFSGSSDKSVILWDLASGAQIWKLTGDTHSLNGVAIAPDGKRALSAGIGNTTLWRIAE